MTTILIVGTILIALLSLALWHCYKTNKPLREEARKKAEEKAKQEAREMARVNDMLRRDLQREEIYSDIEQALTDPHRFLTASFTSPRHKWKYGSLAELANILSEYKNHRQEFGSTAERLDKQSQLIREQRSQIKALQANIEDIKQALQMGTPVEL
jgi:hypothetical protein